MNQTPAPRTVAIHLLALPESTASVLYGLYDVLTSVGVVWPMLTGKAPSPVRFEVRIVGESADSFTCVGGIPVAPHCSFADAGRADAIIVTDLMMPFDADPHGNWPAPVAWLRDQFADGALLCSVCTGSVLLAESGLLDGHETTTHWAFNGFFRRYYPEVTLQADRVLVCSGPDRRIISSGGVASWEDLALHLIGRFCGQEEAIRTAKLYVLGDRSVGQLAYAAMPRPPQHDDAAIAASQDWIAENYHAANAVAGMAACSGLAERTFKRRFRIATGYAPIAYVQTLRIEEAKQLLETTDEPTDAIAPAVGYEDPASFRRLFKRETGLTPGEYRRRFRAVGRSQGDAEAVPVP